MPVKIRILFVSIIVFFLGAAIAFTLFQARPQSPPVVVKGPGGPCMLKIKVLGIKPPKTPMPLKNVQADLYKSDDYSKPVASVVTGSKGKFTMRGLPAGTYDLILKGDGFFSRKMPDIRLDSLAPARLKHMAIYSLKMKCKRVLICFKEGTPKDEQDRVIWKSGLVIRDTIKVKPKSGGRPVEFLSAEIPEKEKLPAIVDDFLLFPCIRYVYPSRNTR